MAKVDIAVGVRRAIVEDIAFILKILFHHEVIDILLFPAREQFFFYFSKVRPDGKIGFRQI